MRLTKEKLVAFWRIRKQIFENPINRPIVERFESIKNLFQDILKVNLTFDGGLPQISEKQLLIDDKKSPSTDFFACMQDGMTADTAYTGVENMAKAFHEHSDLILRIGCMLGGFDFETKIMKDEFRIISNRITNGDDNGGLCSYGQIRHPSSHFADNNYFFTVIDTIQKIKAGNFDPDCSKINLRWPNESYYGSGPDYLVNAKRSQINTLKTRFPYKFFYMWTHQDFLYPVSLLAYRNLVQQEDPDISFDKDKLMNLEYSIFAGEWESYSTKLCSCIPEEDRCDNFWEEMSKLISIIMTQEQELKNLKELLDSTKALILFGPPGTGKTFQAKELICQELGIETTELNDYKIGKNPQNNKGEWEIVQFHPSYTYEDFIGGITPKLTGDTLGYALKEGVFKRLCDSAAKEDNRNKKYVIVIDEINRADLSAVFGELMYALEYRDEKIAIPNFADSFTIPGNVYIIGTMNSMDKSLVTFDLALRRRFAFYKVMPQPEVLGTMLSTIDGNGKSYNLDDDNLYSFIERCKELNRKIADKSSVFDLGEDYQIGHAYFGKIKEFLTKTDDSNCKQFISTFELEKLWIYHLQPLLEEYLGNRVEDGDIRSALYMLKEQFTRPLN